MSLLQETPSAPVEIGLQSPDNVVFFPARPDALLMFEGLDGAVAERNGQLELLAPGSRKAYVRLHKSMGDRLVRAAGRIGLGDTDVRAFAEFLVQRFCPRTEPIYVDGQQAMSFFLNLSTLFSEQEDSQISREAATLLGQERVPLLPVALGDQEATTRVQLVPAEGRHSAQSEKLERATRVVFLAPGQH